MKLITRIFLALLVAAGLTIAAAPANAAPAR
jgi:hypothetical protein